MQKKMQPPKDLASSQKVISQLPPHPRGLPIMELVAWVQTYDRDYKGRTEEGVFEAAYGDRHKARESYRAARHTADDVGVREFCVARIEDQTKHLVKHALTPAT